MGDGFYPGILIKPYIHVHIYYLYIYYISFAYHVRCDNYTHSKYGIQDWYLLFYIVFIVFELNLIAFKAWSGRVFLKVFVKLLDY